MDSTFEMYKEALKEHAYQCALERLEEEYVQIEEYTTAQDRAKVCSQNKMHFMTQAEGKALFVFIFIALAVFKYVHKPLI